MEEKTASKSDFKASSPVPLVNEPDSPFERRDATEEDLTNLPHVVDAIPTAVWVAELIGAAERFTYYGITAPWQNYMQNQMRTGNAVHGALPGALGLGQSTATNIYNAFLFFSYLTPLPFAIVSDTWLGRYTTLCISFGSTTASHLQADDDASDAAIVSIRVGGLAAAMVLIGLGLGGVKATISPFIADQYPNLVPQVIKTRKGGLAVADRTLTIQYVYNAFYWFTNIAGLASVATTLLEKKKGFWAAYLLPMCFLWVAVVLLMVYRKRFVKLAPQGNILPMAAKVLACAVRNDFQLENTRPTVQVEKYGKEVPWTDTFISEMKRGLIACRVIFSFVPFYLCYNQISNNLVSQAGQMDLVGIPNDMIQALNCIACILLGPVIQRIYPLLSARNIAFGPISRIMTAFLIIGASMAYASGIQALIYSRPPCFSHPLACSASEGGNKPNKVNVFVQTPVYFILAVAEILGFVSVSEYSYSKAPRNMRTVVQALTQFTAAVGAAIGMAISPAAKDPHLVVFYASLAGATVLVTAILWPLIRKYDRVDEELNQLDLRALRQAQSEERRVEGEVKE
ncbi:MAG: hypothetical protein M1822_007340 [Bathelium mastoideum]|nr:MAG: hypothetical protein M1822_007340 [Bathelium mastoideum]